ncbi:hypothetical protein PIB30_112404, partial [Stylosanthes scabra]|nr:hypothetical protein [Stylosanthes scabra]
MDETRANFKNQEASIRNLEVQVGQIAKQLNQITEKSPNILPSDTIINPRQECRQKCKAITLRSGKTTKDDSQNQESAEDSYLPPPKEKEEVPISPIPSEKKEKKKEP